MENKNYIVGAVAVVALILAGAGLYRSTTVNVTPQITVQPASVEQPLGSTGQEHTTRENFYNQVFVGGNSLATTTITAAIGPSNTLTASQICDNYELDITSLNVSSTFAFPSSTSVFSRCFGTRGILSKDLWIFNATTTVGSNGSITLLTNDNSSTLYVFAGNTTSSDGILGGYAVGTSTIRARGWGKVTILKSTSSTQPWLFYFFTSYFR